MHARFKIKSTAALVLALGGLSDATAQDRFITQPSRLTPIAQAEPPTMAPPQAASSEPGVEDARSREVSVLEVPPPPGRVSPPAATPQATAATLTRAQSLDAPPTANRSGKGNLTPRGAGGKSGESGSPVATSAAPLQAILASQVAVGPQTPANGVTAIDAPPGWQSVGEVLSQRLARCQALINRKAYFSAREEAEEAMLHLVRVLDLMANQYQSEPAWHAAQRALVEAEDFSTAQRLTSDSDFLQRVVLSHETPVLKKSDLSALAPLAAAQHYRLYAEQKLVDASQGHPWASEVLYALGRCYQAQADSADEASRATLRWRAVTLYRSSRVVAPSNALAANQLGYVLLQVDRPADAREALVASVQLQPSMVAYQNLVETSRRLGDTNLHNWALQNYTAMRSNMPAPSQDPPVLEVDPQTFVAISPYTIGPNPQPGNFQQQQVAPVSPSVPRTAGLPATPSNY